MGEITSLIKVGVGVIVRREDRILVGLRLGSHGAGQYALPGGKPEPGESPMQAAERELDEESGVIARNFRLIPICHYDRFPEFNRHFITSYVLCDWVSGEGVVREPGKCGGWLWPRWGSLPEPVFGGLSKLRDSGIDWASF